MLFVYNHLFSWENLRLIHVNIFITIPLFFLENAIFFNVLSIKFSSKKTRNSLHSENKRKRFFKFILTFSMNASLELNQWGVQWIELDEIYRNIYFPFLECIREWLERCFKKALQPLLGYHRLISDFLVNPSLELNEWGVQLIELDEIYPNLSLPLLECIHAQWETGSSKARPPM